MPMSQCKYERPKCTRGSSERVNRLRDNYWDHIPSVDIERAVVYTEAYKNYAFDDLVIKRSKAFRNYMESKTIKIYPDELIVGTSGKAPRSFVFCPDINWKWIANELDTIDTREQDPYHIDEEDREIIRKELIPFWEGKSMEEYFLHNITDELRNIATGTNIVFGENKTTCGGGETAVGFENIIFKKGFKGIKEEAEGHLKALDEGDISNFDKRQFYRSLILTCEAVKILNDRYSALAKDMAEKESNLERKAELLEISRITGKVPWEKPESFREAVQVIAIVESLLYMDENTSGYNVGRIDQYLYPFYLKDKKEGTLTDEEALELFECLWIKLAGNMYGLSKEGAKFYVGYVPYHGVTLGGIDKDGNDASNELSYMGLQATINLRMHSPTINVRIHPSTSDDFLLKTIELIACGTGQPAIHFDPTAFKLLKRNGVAEEDTWNYCGVGCVSAQMAGQTCQWNEGGRYSYPVAVDWALFRGFCHARGKQMGLDTGDPLTFTSYGEFERAVEEQLRYLVGIACKASQVVERAQQLRLPKPLRNCLVEGPMEKGQDLMFGTSKYNAGPGLLATGIADLADSMAAVKKLVFDTKEISMETLIKALEADFEGYEDVREILINNAPKYGNDYLYVDEIAAKFLDISVDEAEKYTSIFGSKYINGLVPVMANVPHGYDVWALPSGRKARTPLADGLSPYPGFDKNGPTAVIKSVCGVDHAANGAGTLLNMKLTPDLIKSEEGKRKLISLLRAESTLGGYHIQFNVVDKETLLDAQDHPEDHADLLVRVAGYSAFFVDLRKEAQDLIVNRTEVKAI